MPAAVETKKRDEKERTLLVETKTTVQTKSAVAQG